MSSVWLQTAGDDSRHRWKTIDCHCSTQGGSKKASVVDCSHLRNIWNPTSFNCLSPACRACDYVYIDCVRRSRSSSCRLLRPINCQTYITLHLYNARNHITSVRQNSVRVQRPYSFILLIIIFISAKIIRTGFYRASATQYANARYWYSKSVRLSVRPSVRPSVTFRYQMKTA